MAKVGRRVDHGERPEELAADEEQEANNLHTHEALPSRGKCRLDQKLDQTKDMRRNVFKAILQQKSWVSTGTYSPPGDGWGSSTPSPGTRANGTGSRQPGRRAAQAQKWLMLASPLRTTRKKAQGHAARTDPYRRQAGRQSALRCRLRAKIALGIRQGVSHGIQHRYARAGRGMLRSWSAWRAPGLLHAFLYVCASTWKEQ